MALYLSQSLFPAVPVPFTYQGTIHLSALDSYVRYMAQQPLTGVALWAHTGRGLYLSQDQRRQVFQAWRHGLKKEHQIICGAGSSPDCLRESLFLNKALDMAKQARDLGADGLLIYPPTWYRNHPNRDEKIVEYHRMFAEQGLPIVLFYLYETAGGISYSPKVLQELFCLPQVVAIKMATLDSVMTYQDVSSLIALEFPEVQILTGEDRMFGYTLTRGAVGALVGLGAICVSLQKSMIDAYASQDYGFFLSRMGIVDELAEVIFIQPMEGYIERLLYWLQGEGIIPANASCDPWGPGLTMMEKEKIDKLRSRHKGLTKVV